MDLYLPDEFYALSESPNARRENGRATHDDREWLGGEAFVTPLATAATRRAPAEPDPIWFVV